MWPCEFERKMDIGQVLCMGASFLLSTGTFLESITSSNLGLRNLANHLLFDILEATRRPVVRSGTPSISVVVQIHVHVSVVILWWNL